MDRQALVDQARWVVADCRKLVNTDQEAGLMGALSLLADAKELVTFGPECRQKALDAMNMVSVILIDLRREGQTK